MTRKPFCYEPEPESPRTRLVIRVIAGLTAVAYLGMVYWVSLRDGLPTNVSEWVGFGLHSAMLVIFGVQMAFPRRFSRSPYIKIDMGSVEFTTSNKERFWPGRSRILLSSIEHIEVRMMEIVFTRFDGTREVMPLGTLPYEVVRQVKARFTGLDSLQQLSGGALARRALEHQN